MPLSIFNFRKPSPWRLLARGLTLVLATGLTVTLLAVFLPKNIHSYYFGFQKKIELLAHTQAPRLILCGGSNVAFGVDSEAISKQLHIRTINTGLHAGLGLSYMLRHVQFFIRPGDVVLLIPEYQFFTSSVWRGQSALSELFLEVPTSASYWGPENLITLVETLPSVVQKRFMDTFIFGKKVQEEKLSHRDFYSAQSFNKYGDVTSHLNEIRPGKTIPLMYNRKDVAYCFKIISYIRKFIEASEKKNAQVYLLPPCIRREDYEATTGVFITIYDELRRRFPKHTLSAPLEFVFEADRYFFDAEYHLNAEGRTLRTELIISSLKKTEWYLSRDRS